MIYKVFNEEIAVFKYDNINKFTGNKNLKKDIDDYFNSPHIQKADAVERYGNALTSVPFAQKEQLFPTFNLEKYDLGKWIKEHITKGANELKFDRYKDTKKFSMVRSWMNRMYKDSQGAVHNHKSGCDMVCIFYYEAPPGASELVFLNTNSHLREKKAPYSEYPKEDRYHFQPEPGHLVCHFPGIYHSVAVHNNELPRTCFIFEPKFNYKPNKISLK